MDQEANAGLTLAQVAAQLPPNSEIRVRGIGETPFFFGALYMSARLVCVCSPGLLSDVLANLSEAARG